MATEFTKSTLELYSVNEILRGETSFSLVYAAESTSKSLFKPMRVSNGKNGSVPIYDVFYGFVVFCVIHMVKRFFL